MTSSALVQLRWAPRRRTLWLSRKVAKREAIFVSNRTRWSPDGPTKEPTTSLAPNATSDSCYRQEERAALEPTTHGEPHRLGLPISRQGSLPCIRYEEQIYIVGLGGGYRLIPSVEREALPAPFVLDPG